LCRISSFAFWVIESDETNRLNNTPRTIDAATTIMSSPRLIPVPRNINELAKIPVIAAVAIAIAKALVGEKK